MSALNAGAVLARVRVVAASGLPLPQLSPSAWRRALRASPRGERPELLAALHGALHVLFTGGRVLSPDVDEDTAQDIGRALRGDPDSVAALLEREGFPEAAVARGLALDVTWLETHHHRWRDATCEAVVTLIDAYTPLGPDGLARLVALQHARLNGRTDWTPALWIRVATHPALEGRVIDAALATTLDISALAGRVTDPRRALRLYRQLTRGGSTAEMRRLPLCRTVRRGLRRQWRASPPDVNTVVWLLANPQTDEATGLAVLRRTGVLRHLRSIHAERWRILCADTLSNHPDPFPSWLAALLDGAGTGSELTHETRRMIVRMLAGDRIQAALRAAGPA